MKFEAPALSRGQQAELLIARGLEASPEALVSVLDRIGYVRFTNYLRPFQQPGDLEARLVPGTTLGVVWDSYLFDRQLRLHLLDAIERIELAIKAQLSNAMSTATGPFGHIDISNWSTHGLEERYERFLIRLRAKEEDHQDEKTLRQWRSTYPGEEHLPVWLACEIMDFGCMLTLFKGCSPRIKQAIAREYEVSDNVLESWLIAVNTLRNMCDHHSRVWNRTHGISVKIPKKDSRWKIPVEINTEPRENFALLTILRYLLQSIAPNTGWAARLEFLWTHKHPHIPIQKMGFPSNWKECPIWQA